MRNPRQALERAKETILMRTQGPGFHLFGGVGERRQLLHVETIRAAYASVGYCARATGPFLPVS